MSPRLPASMAVVALAAFTGCGPAARGLEFSPFHHSRHNAIVRIETHDRRIALTFDDGPTDATPRLLRLLHGQRVRATFFDVGRRVLQRPALARAELRAGHEIGNHTWDHANLTRLPTNRMLEDLGGGALAITMFGLPAPRLFRPPLGAFDERVGRAAELFGERMVGWDLPFEKYLRRYGAHVAVDRLVEDARPGSIVLMHAERAATQDRELRAVRKLIAALRARGFEFVTAGELIDGPSAA